MKPKIKLTVGDDNDPRVLAQEREIARFSQWKDMDDQTFLWYLDDVHAHLTPLEYELYIRFAALMNDELQERLAAIDEELAEEIDEG